MKTITKFSCPLFAALALVCFAVLSTAQAVTPPPDGGYPGSNTAEGANALFTLTTGVWNTAIGGYALFSDTTGGANTALGTNALYYNTTGSYNTATGVQALLSNTTGGVNTANGAHALFNNSAGFANTATGFDALAFNSTGIGNTATGVQALLSNTTGGVNTANGYQALYSSNGVLNTAVGAVALFSNTDGAANAAIGGGALYSNTTGSFNTAVGNYALERTNGNYNIALGDHAGMELITGSYNIDIGSNGFSGESNTIRIGDSNHTATFIAGISGTAVTGTMVVVNADGQLGVAPSSERFKENIKPINEDSETLFALKPVTFSYKKEIDAAGTSQFGLVAEDVEKMNPDLVVRDKEGKPYSVRYDQVNAMLLNEFLKEHQKVEALEKQVEKLTAGLQKVSAQIEANKSAPQVVNNP